MSQKTITTQPRSVHAFAQSCPPGLEPLLVIDRLYIRQQIELLEVMLGFETNNQYVITNPQREQIYYALENTDFCSRNCCGSNRAFEILIIDNKGEEVLNLSRPLRCGPCCLQELTVASSKPQYMPLGYVMQDFSFCIPKYSIENANHETVFKIEGPLFTFGCGSDVEFQLIVNLVETEVGKLRGNTILTRNEQVEVGLISKIWGGFFREAYTDADNFSVIFPMDADVITKATILGAAFLIDFKYFEN